VLGGSAVGGSLKADPELAVVASAALGVLSLAVAVFLFVLQRELGAIPVVNLSADLRLFALAFGAGGGGSLLVAVGVLARRVAG